MRIFLAGAAGAIGRRLMPLLLNAGHHVTGTTRSAEKARDIARAGAKAVVVDMFDAAGVDSAVALAQPEVVIHQLTDLPQVIDRACMADALARNARLRVEATQHLVDAAVNAGATRVVAQSIAFLYAPGPEPHRESDSLVADGITAQGVRTLESLVTGTPGFDGLVLRYGRLYGPGTWSASAPEPPALHVDAAAHAALLAVGRGEPGVYNIAEDDGGVAIARAREQLGFDPDFRLDPSVRISGGTAG